ncbi:MAG TPA: hypothetical protein DF383_00395 [Deltaproteobacteria bacterium]|nr:hypothetical protein [Deltaproteobacteria bacterium]
MLDLDQIINSFADPLFVKDREHRWVLLNDAACQFLGYPREQLLGKSDYDFFPKEEADIFWEKDEIVFKTGLENINEEELTDAEDKTHVIVTRKTLYTDPQGNSFIVGIIRDITDRRRAERELLKVRDQLEQGIQERTAELTQINRELKKEIRERVRIETFLAESEKKYRDLVETSRELIWSVDAAGRWTFLSQKATRQIYGREPEEMLGRSFTDFTSPQHLEQDWETFGKIKEGHPFVHYDTVHLRKDGRPVDLSFNAVVVYGEGGKVLGTRGTASDVTARRLAEERLRESEERIRTTIDHALDAVIVFDEEGEIVYWNPQAEKIFGWSAAEALGKKDTELIAPLRYGGVYRQTRLRFLKENRMGLLNRRLETELRHADGHELPVELSVTPLHLGGHWMFSAFVRDITERKLAAQAIQRKTLELARSNKELQDFAYVASHDLQEPLHKIIAFTERLRVNCENLNAKAVDSLERIRHAALRMRQLIADLLQYARVTTQARPVERVDMATLIREVLSMLELRIAETGAEIQIGILPAVLADRSQMFQLFQNLLGNALKFVKPGEKPWLRISGRPLDSATVEFTVEDHGLGFDPTFSEQIFKPFQRLHGRSEYEGTGMGLAICQKIVQRHNGDISVQSTPGKGTCFKVRLPRFQGNEEK